MNLTKKNTITVLIIIIFLGAVLRFYNLGATSFVADEFLDINSSMAYAKTGVWQNWDFNFNRVNADNVFAARDSRAWIYKWQVAEVLKMFSASEATARSVSAIWGLISIAVVFYAARYFTGKKEIGLIAAFLFAVSIMGIVFDRKLRMYAMFLPVYLLFSWMFYKFLEEEYKGKIKFFKNVYGKIGINLFYFIPMMIAGIASILTHQLAGNIIIVFIVYAAISIYLSMKKSKKTAFNKYILGLAAIIIGFLGGLVLFPGKMKLYTKEIKFFTSHWSYFSKVFSDYSNIILAVLLLAAGIFYLYKIKNLKKEALWLSVSFFAVLFSAVLLWDRNVGDQYIFFAIPFAIILISSGIYWAAEFFGKSLANLGKYQYVAPLAAILLILPNYGYFFEIPNTYKQTSESSNANYKKVFGYFMKAKEDGDVLITRNFRNFYWKGAKVKVYDFGGELAENKLSLDEIKKIQNDNPHGWFIISDNDDAYVANDAMDYVSKNFARVSNSQVRGSVMVYRWGESL